MLRIWGIWQGLRFRVFVVVGLRHGLQGSLGVRMVLALPQSAAKGSFHLIRA